MYTYKDFLEVGEREEERMKFIRAAITQYKSEELYRTAVVAEEYDRHKNTTINKYQKLLYTMSGQAVPDNYSANYKVASRFFNRFVTQENQFLLGNGVTWANEGTAERLGEDFDYKLQMAGRYALVAGVSYGFFNEDHLEVYKATEFVPLYDEENGALMAGIRFWQVADTKPLRAKLFELDGYTDYLWDSDDELKINGIVLHEKRPYILKVAVTEADGEEIYDAENYPSFPIVPLWGNPYHQSELVGIREQIDAYDLIKSGFCNTVDEASFVYWTIQNAGGMDDIDLSKFIEHMKTIHAAVVEDDGAKAESHSLEAPYASREALLDRLEKDMYKDFMALDTERISGGAITATQIRAAYEPINSKADQYEYCIKEFVKDILKIAGVEDVPTFTRSMLVNIGEEVGVVLQAAMYLDQEYITGKILNLLGDGDKVDAVLSAMDREDGERMMGASDYGQGAEDGEQTVE